MSPRDRRMLFWVLAAVAAFIWAHVWMNTTP